ncbi:hypothetical protein TNIN_441601 [Trichonephila inaurata madagascariensis]|uniref:Uncharacterized protein n=1 Tax=Trichonephila inaurata madagascariensis TaxID=2747483 RepID=A0A8X7CQC5_9ARAC|nr:hypothetical protein TNIN_441601 [Trichonephila inaurata madagascariensis]
MSLTFTRWLSWSPGLGISRIAGTVRSICDGYMDAKWRDTDPCKCFKSNKSVWDAAGMEYPSSSLVTSRIQAVLRSIDCPRLLNGVCARHVIYTKRAGTRSER